MLSTLAWRQLRSSEIAGEVEALREDTLRYFLGIAAIGYVAWHLATITLSAPEDGPRYWTLFLVVVAGLAATRWVQQRSSRLAALCFLASSVVSTTAAVWLLAAPLATLFYPLVALVAVVLLHPLAGVVVGVGSLGLLWSLWQAGPLGFLSADRLIETGVGSLLAVLAAWALGRNMVTAAGWALASYGQALRNTQEAQSHRAQLVQALKQLDTAYYRLERANAALEMAWKAAEAAERSKSEFVTNISHELRTPLNLVVGFSEMIVTSPEVYGTPLPPAYRADLFAIYRSAQHLLTLTDDVLDLARVGAGRMALAREPADLGQIIRDACDIVREYVSAKGLRLRVETEPGLPVLSIDRVRIRQVLLNLLTNAARFTERGGITVSASLRDGSVVVKVVDTGRGIAPAEAARVFDEFYHDDAERGRRRGEFGGTGLGLPISKKFVELHGGQMGVESQLGVGTTFWFTLPTVAVDGSARAPSGRPLRLPGGLSGERALVLVGADNRLAQFLQRHLRGYRVLAALDPDSALDAAAETQAVAVLADVDAPALEAGRAYPVPLLRVPLPHGERLAAELGAAACLTKPVARQDLRTVIERLDRPLRTVLIVDDDPGFVRLMRLMLGTCAPRSDLDVLTAHNGREALALLETTRPDLVLLDLVMPEMGGAEVAAAMAASADLADVPVVIVSGQDQGEWRFPLRGPISITKPEGFGLEELLGAIEANLGVLEPPRPDAG